jgi:ATP-grasp domain, R2K clade family 3
LPREQPAKPYGRLQAVKPVILYRRGMNPDADKVEILAATEAGLDLYEHRTAIPEGSIVVGRMSVLPFYKELELDLVNRRSVLVNSYRQHQFIADMREWCECLGDLTPKLYPRLQDLPEKGPFVLKGQTNSKKFLWNTHMFAETRRDATEVMLRLQEDSLLSSQEIYARDYVPLVKLAEGFNGLPITKEFRFFVCNGQVLCGAFYWASHVDDVPPGETDANDVPDSFLQKVIDRIGDSAAFYTIDVALKETGDWMVVEINDGQMSGLSCNDPGNFYRGLHRVNQIGYHRDCMKFLDGV